MLALVGLVSRKGSRDEREDLGADRGQSGAVERPSPSLLPALVGRRADARTSSPATRVSTATRSRRSPSSARRRRGAAGAAGARRHADEEREHVRSGTGSSRRPVATPTTRRPPRPPPACAPGPRPATADEALVRLYAIESGQPEISRTKRAGLVDRYGFADGEATAYFRVHEGRDVEHAAEVRALIEEVAGRRRRGPPGRRRGGRLPGQLAPAGRRLIGSDAPRRPLDRDRPRDRPRDRDRRRVRLRVQRGHGRRAVDQPRRAVGAVRPAVGLERTVRDVLGI